MLRNLGAAAVLVTGLLAFGHHGHPGSPLSTGLHPFPSSEASTVAINGPWWAQHAVDKMHAPVLPDQTVILSPCPGYSIAAACNFDTPASPIYIDPAQFLNLPGPMSQTLLRELGGRFGTTVMTAGAEWEFARLMHSRRPWINGNGTGLIEVFEDAYADCALGLVPHRETLQRSDGRWVDAAGYRPSARRHRRVCSLIGWMGAAVGLMAPAS